MCFVEVHYWLVAKISNLNRLAACNLLFFLTPSSATKVSALFEYGGTVQNITTHFVDIHCCICLLFEEGKVRFNAAPPFH